MNIAPTTLPKRVLCAAIAAGLFAAGLMLVSASTQGSLVAVAAGAALAGIGATWLGAEAHSLLRQAMKPKSRNVSGKF
jgi:hypothetical protein